ncbi:MAG: type II toxin-antitoxin system RelE/ParE family toxin [Acetobacteraceae bacterium]|nr:type II toxin-antitoxin system RelE/ParE family toxin [Acetobacteraceae bacterium]
MTGYRLSPEAEGDLDDIKRHLMGQGGAPLVRHVLSEIQLAPRFLTRTPGVGHSREDPTNEPVKFWPVFSYPIVYDPAMRPLGVAGVLHGSRNLEALFRHRPPQA